MFALCFGCLCRVYLLFGFEAFDLVMFIFLLVTTLRVHPAVTRLTVYRRLEVWVEEKIRDMVTRFGS